MHSRTPRSAEDRRKAEREQAAARRAADREPSREAARRWAAKNPGYQLAYKYGMTLERWAQMLDAQDGGCYLCGEPLDVEAPRAIHVDHDHACCRGNRSCGTCVRGLACFSCNVGIAKFREDPDRMRRVADNLEMATRRLRDDRPGAAINPRPGHDAAAVTPRGDERR